MNLGQYNIHTPTAETIIEKWFQKGVNENTDFTDKFIYLWVSFNAFYKAYSTGNYSEYTNFISQRKNNDREQIEYIKNRFSHVQIEKQNGITEFYNFLQNRKDGKTGGIIRLEKNVLKKYSDIRSIDEFLEVIYTIRNNLFHGSKNPEIENDKQVLEKSSKALENFLSIIYN